MQIFSTLRFSHNKARGFTITELIVSIGIMAAITTTVVMSQSQYSETTLLNTTAANVGLAIREAQVYGISVREFGVGSNEFTAGYGIEFSTIPDTSRSSYISFADRGVTPNKIYDTSSPTPEYISQTTFPGSIKIQKICKLAANDSEDCSMSLVDITFIRPETDANIIFADSAGTYLPASGIKGARIYIESLSNVSRKITVYTTGQISVQ